MSRYWFNARTTWDVDLHLPHLFLLCPFTVTELMTSIDHRPCLWAWRKGAKGRWKDKRQWGKKQLRGLWWLWGHLLSGWGRARDDHETCQASRLRKMEELYPSACRSQCFFCLAAFWCGVGGVFRVGFTSVLLHVHVRTRPPRISSQDWGAVVVSKADRMQSIC